MSDTLAPYTQIARDRTRKALAGREDPHELWNEAADGHGMRRGAPDCSARDAPRGRVHVLWTARHGTALLHAIDDVAAPSLKNTQRHSYSGIILRSRFSSDALLTSVASARIESRTKLPSIHLFLLSTRLMT